MIPPVTGRDRCGRCHAIITDPDAKWGLCRPCTGEAEDRQWEYHMGEISREARIRDEARAVTTPDDAETGTGGDC